jgi:hypothetical protein
MKPLGTINCTLLWGLMVAEGGVVRISRGICLEFPGVVTHTCILVLHAFIFIDFKQLEVFKSDI